MKKIKGFLLTIAVLVLMPLNVFASEKINVYIFKGDGCGYCAKALTFFEGLSDEYQNYFNLVEKEVWYDDNNAALMQKVADYFNEDVNGVPYIVIGEKTFQGFDESQYGNEIKNAIKTGYENTDGTYKDVVAAIAGGEVKTDEDNNTSVTIIVIIAAAAGLGFLIYMARDDEEEVEEQLVEKSEPKVTKKTTTKKTTSKTSSKKTTTKSAPKKSTTKKTNKK